MKTCMRTRARTLNSINSTGRTAQPSSTVLSESNEPQQYVGLCTGPGGPTSHTNRAYTNMAPLIFP